RAASGPWRLSDRPRGSGERPGTPGRRRARGPSVSGERWDERPASPHRLESGSWRVLWGVL
ncbi:MAG: hypothetical protein ACREDK_04515, partial [Thermoplasmata archaeon]